MTNQEFLESITQDGEEWRDVIGYEGIYLISNFGRIASLWRTANNRFSDVAKPPHLLYPDTKTGAVYLSNQSCTQKRRIHLLVATHFLATPNPDEIVLEFIDGDKTNCRADNLHWRKVKSRKKTFDTADLKGEIWKEIKDYEGLYLISSHGRVKSCRFNKILSPFKGGTIGYLYISLVKDGIKTKTTIHRLVAKHFCDNRSGFNEIDHIDGNPLNNHYTNLQWCNHTTNMNNEITRKRCSDSLKGSFNNATSKKVVQIKDGVVIATYPSVSEAGRFGYSTTSVSACCRGEQRTYAGYNWEYVAD